MIKYSIITPVFNRVDCILRCLESVTRNISGRKDVEHIVVDDGSSDATPAIIKQYAAEHPHVHCIFFSQNCGTNAARNAAIASARGQFCIILDSDDYWDDCALSVIDETASAHPDIRHFCFAPDDMQPIYAETPLLAGKSECIITFEDFLLGRVSGDFVHVMNTDIIQSHPFDEQLRIYEGVFFLAFYKEAKYILFVNKMVSHRERGRSDSVTREVFRTNKTTILRTIKAKELLIEKYAEDLLQTDGGAVVLYKHHLTLLDNYLLLGDYDKAKNMIREIEQTGHFFTPCILKWIYYLRLGSLYFYLLSLYLQVKYNVCHASMK